MPQGAEAQITPGSGLPATQDGPVPPLPPVVHPQAGALLPVHPAPAPVPPPIAHVPALALDPTAATVTVSQGIWPMPAPPQQMSVRVMDILNEVIHQLGGDLLEELVAHVATSGSMLGVPEAREVSEGFVRHSKAASEFIDSGYVLESGIPVWGLSQLIPVFNVDGSPNEAGIITEVADVVLRYNGHSEHAQFVVTQLGKEKLILRMSWLWKHNPEVNWETGKTRHEAQLIRKIVSQLCAGPFPSICAIDAGDPEDRGVEGGRFPEDMSDLPELTLDLDNNNGSKDDPLLEDGDCILYTWFSPPESIYATATVSQQLAEAFVKNSVPAGTSIPEWARKFGDVFSKKSFDSLSEHRSWDHAIELVLDAKPANCKVYPISPLKQKELDAFIEEGLATATSVLLNP
ncbi:hypothetical protein MSAN_01366500 [Mycena sanguinolenta]|uniref:Uncharacterized protein n=1 Tax=Mycena sanguinolenta TaxID=230812 RepID=A0A8H6Y5G1_9AGAR|nr:hypothetical protein MSAN_01366500 [Mycena sanguinolenta]